MEKFISNLWNWFVKWLWFLLALLVWWWIFVFASSLTASDWETLTATKWNALVNKVDSIAANSNGWTAVDTWDTTTFFDPNCEWRILRNSPSGNSTTSVPDSYRYFDHVSNDWVFLSYRQASDNFRVYNTDKSKIYTWGTWRKISKLEKRCN